jgi:hypothetical protein
VEDLTVRRIWADRDGMNGIGVQVWSLTIAAPASLTMTRADIGDVVRWGVLVDGWQVSLHASDLVVHDIRAAGCGATTCPGQEGGAAIMIDDAGRAEVVRFAVSRSAYAGLVATAGVWADLSSGRIEMNSIGVVTSPLLRPNPIEPPGVRLVDVVVGPNEVDFLTTEVMIAAPGVSL